MKITARTLLSRKRWELFFTRGNRVFWAMGAPYIQSLQVSQRISDQIAERVPNPPSGEAFVRWGRKTGSTFRPALLLTGVGRLGNSVIQTLNAVYLARVLGTREVLYHRFDAIQNAKLDLGEGVSAQKLRSVIPRGITPPKIIWRTYAMGSEGLIADPCSSEFFEARLSLGQGIDIENSPPKAMRSSKSLTIYLRGGDIFGSKPHPNYGQPPWAFYERVLSHKGWTEVRLVSEDSVSPVRQQIVDWCAERELTLIESGATLPDAVREISLATSLAMARGTFVPAILLLAPAERVLYIFDEPTQSLICQGHNTIYRVMDRDGAYVRSVLRNSWANTPEQRGLMVSYPLAQLSKPTKYQSKK